jgi:hypothetical protein
MKATMTDYPITLEEVVSWLRSKENVAEVCNVTLAEVKQNLEHLPSACADFDSAAGIGRISIWVSGEIDFEVLRRSDAKMVFFQHESVRSLNSAVVERGFEAFVRSMADPDDSAK